MSGCVFGLRVVGPSSWVSLAWVFPAVFCPLCSLGLPRCVVRSLGGVVSGLVPAVRGECFPAVCARMGPCPSSGP